MPASCCDQLIALLRLNPVRAFAALAVAVMAITIPGALAAIGLVPDGAQLWRPSDLWTGGTPPVPGAFGAALASGDFDGDGILDLAIGDPTADVGCGNGGPGRDERASRSRNRKRHGEVNGTGMGAA
jgi:hypothetical protein